MENNEQSKPKRRYKKRIKKVTTNDGLLSDATKEIREIPMYDPYTGEANPRYEELTGKPNPLMAPKRFTIQEIADNARKDMELFGLPIINKKNNVESNKDYLDIKSNTRFLVIFPEDFGIKLFYVKSVVRPSLTISKKSFMGITYCTKTSVSNAVVELIDFIDGDVKLNKKLNELLKDGKRFDFTIQTLNPNGVVIEEMLLNDCYINKIGLSPLLYGDNSISTTTIEIQPKRYSIK